MIKRSEEKNGVVLFTSKRELRIEIDRFDDDGGV